MTGHRCLQPLEAPRPENSKSEGQESGTVVARAWRAEEESGWEDDDSERVARPRSSACENDGDDGREESGDR